MTKSDYQQFIDRAHQYGLDEEIKGIINKTNDPLEAISEAESEWDI